jgi:hypothetical protein
MFESQTYIFYNDLQQGRRHAAWWLEEEIADPISCFYLSLMFKSVW